jgi:hypothetical protein
MPKMPYSHGKHYIYGHNNNTTQENLPQATNANIGILLLCSLTIHSTTIEK